MPPLTETQNTITLGGTELSINSGNVVIVSLGAEKLTIDVNKERGFSTLAKLRRLASSR